MNLWAPRKVGNFTTTHENASLRTTLLRGV